jgi:hypothetical protein
VLSWLLGVRSAKAAERSAKAAEDSAAEAAKVARVELDRDHETYRPPQPLTPHFEISTNSRTDHRQLFFKFTPPRSYRIFGDAIEGRSRSRLPFNGLAFPAGQEVKVSVQTLYPVRKTASVEELHLRFWPPAESDEDVEQWTCQCGRPTASDGPAHWEWRVRVETPEDPEYDITESLG